MRRENIQPRAKNLHQSRISERSFETKTFGPAGRIGKTPSNVLVIDIGGTHVKVLATGHRKSRQMDSGEKMTPEDMVEGVLELTKDWTYDAVSIGYPGAALHGQPVAEPFQLGDGWVGFDFVKAFGCPVKLINDAAMQAMGSYDGGKMLFVGLGTGLGSTVIADGVVEPMELGHLPYKHLTYEDYLGKRGVKRLGKKKWRKAVDKIMGLLIKALQADYIVIGGGNVHKLKELPEGCRLGSNANAFEGGFRMWGLGTD